MSGLYLGKFVSSLGVQLPLRLDSREWQLSPNAAFGQASKMSRTSEKAQCADLHTARLKG